MQLAGNARSIDQLLARRERRSDGYFVLRIDRQAAGKNENFVPLAIEASHAAALASVRERKPFLKPLREDQIKLLIFVCRCNFVWADDRS
jgi:uncharacterized protein YceH (UPF0502 family)